MNGLLIEDDPDKAKKIIDFINANFQYCSITHRLSYQSGLKELFSIDFDFLLLDMSLPSYDQGHGSYAGKPRNFGGRDILKEMKRYNKSARVKIITQYNEFDGGLVSMKDLDEELKNKYASLYDGYIIYSSSRSDWENELKIYLNTFSK